MAPAVSEAGPAPAVRQIPAGERVYAIGDIHGRLDLLEKLVAAIRADNAARVPARVRIILVGDIIDRGPDSAAIVDRCMAFTARTDAFVVLKGNHEAMMVDALRGDFIALALWLRQGGGAALQSWGVAEEVIADGASPALIRAARDRVPPEVIAWLTDLPLMYRIGDYLFVHAGIRPGRQIEDQSNEDLLWIRREFLESEEDQGVVVVHGHSVSDDGVTIRPNRIGIDTGAYRTGLLSALALEGDHRWILASNSADR